MIRKIGLIAGQNFSGWHRNARIWLTFALGLVLCLMLSDQMLTRAQTYDASIQIFEPFIWTFGDGAVSYTHLDVYKRQRSNNRTRCSLLRSPTARTECRSGWIVDSEAEKKIRPGTGTG